MRKMKKILAAICLTTVMALGVPVITPMSTQIMAVEAATKVKLNKTSVYVSKGDTVQLSMKGTSKKVKWTSTNKKIATVTTKGKVKGIKKGKTTVTATVNGKNYKCKVNVEVPSISKKSASLKTGESITLKMNNTKQAVKWSSSNKRVATVSTKGNVKGIKAGTATITAKVGSKKYTCKVTVKNINVSSVSLDQSNVTLYVGNSKTLTAKVSPSNATNQTITWSSSNTRVATVNKGSVKAIAPGTATITASAANGKKCTCKVIVEYDPIDIEENYMGAYGINALYKAAKFPSTLHIKAIYASDYSVNGYGDRYKRVVVEGYAQNSLGSYATAYVVVLKFDNGANYPDAVYLPGKNCYLLISVYNNNPGVEDNICNNATVMGVYDRMFNPIRPIPFD